MTSALTALAVTADITGFGNANNLSICVLI